MRTRFTLVALCLLLAVAALPSMAEEEATENDGKKIFLGANCNMCHAVPKASIEAKTKSDKLKGPDLLGADPAFDAEWLAQYLRGKEEGKEGQSHSKEFKGSDEELQALVDWLLEQKAEG